MARASRFLLKFWYSLVVAPVIIYFVLSLAIGFTLGNPEFYRREIHRRKLAEVIAGNLPQVLGQDSPLARSLKFEPQWTEENLNALIKGFLDYLNGRTSKLILSVDLKPIYDQLPEAARNGQLQLSGIAELAAKSKDEKASLVSRYQESYGMQSLLKLENYIRLGKFIEYLLALVVVASILLTIWFKREKREVLGLLGAPLLTQSSALAIILWISQRFYLAPGSAKVLGRFTGSWMLPLVQAGVETLSYLVKLLTTLSLVVAGVSVTMLLAEWIWRRKGRAADQRS